MSSFLERQEALRRERRRSGPWSTDDERAWLEKHPEDSGTPHFGSEGEEAGAVAPPAPPRAGDSEVAGTSPSPSTTDSTADADLIPDITYERSDEDDEIDALVAGVSILDAYTRWCGKSTPEPGSRVEGIKVSCPNPAHPDKDPSAWLNLDKDVWYCGACGFGGDQYDIAAWHFGYPVPDYKGEDFPKLKRAIAEDLGYTVKRSLGGKKVLVGPPEPEPEPEPPVDEEPIPVVETPLAPVVDLVPRDADEEREMFDLGFEWEPLAPAGTFLHEWMNIVRHDDVPEEFYFWLGLQAIGLAVGRDVAYFDQPKVYSNLYICLLGGTGTGKSRAIGNLTNLLREAMPYDIGTSAGVALVPSPGSAEALIDSFSSPVFDPADPKKISFYNPVRGLVRFDEFKTLVARSERSGSPFKPIVMEFFDNPPDIELKTRTHGLARAELPFAAMVAGTQPRIVSTMFGTDDVDSGFLNRWSFVAGRPKKRIGYGRKPFILKPAADKLANLRGWSSMHKTGFLGLEPAAIARWLEFFHDTIVPAQEAEDAGMLTRTDLLIKKLMLLFALNEKARDITVRHVEMSILLWPYIKEVNSRLSGVIGQDEMEKVRAAIESACVGHMKRHSEPPTFREINRLISHRKFNMGLVRNVIKFMVELDQLQETAGKRGGVTRYRYVG